MIALENKGKVTMTGTIAICLALICAFTWQTKAFCKEIYTDRVAAVVNGDVILESDIKKHKQPFIRSMIGVPLGVVPPGKVPTEKEILDELVVIRLLQQEASRQGVKVDDQGVQMSLDSIKKRNNLTQDQFVLFLAINGLDYSEYRNLLKRQMVLTKLMQTEVQQKVPLSEDDARLHFKKHKDEIEAEYQKLLGGQPAPESPPDVETKFEVPTHTDTYVGGKIRLRQITLKLPSNPKKKDVEAVKAKAREIFEQVNKGADFAQLAKKYSQDNNAASGGDLGFMEYKNMVPQLQQMVQQMKEGDITPPLPGRDGVMMFYLAEAKDRQTKRVPLPEKLRKQYENQMKKAQQERDAQRKQKEKERAEAAPDALGDDQSTLDSSNKAADKGGILTPEEEKEYRKLRRKVIGIVRTERVMARLHELIEELKKDSIIEVKI